MDKTNIAKILGKSYSYIHKASNGSIENETADLVNILIQINEKKSLMELFLADETHTILDIAITKARNAKLIKHAVNLQRFRQLLLDIAGTGEDIMDLVAPDAPPAKQKLSNKAK